MTAGPSTPISIGISDSTSVGEVPAGVWGSDGIRDGTTPGITDGIILGMADGTTPGIIPGTVIIPAGDLLTGTPARLIGTIPTGEEAIVLSVREHRFVPEAVARDWEIISQA